jgi:hypothetical protein
MAVYRATILLMTAAMLVLHVFEWRTAAEFAAAFGPCPGNWTWFKKLRLALRLEALYYLLVIPLLYTTSNTLVGRLMLGSAVYHWVGLALVERRDALWGLAAGRQSGSAIRIGISAIALLDLGEMVMLTCLWRTLFNSLIR